MFFRNPVKLDAGIHTLFVPVRLKGPGIVKCFVKTLKSEKILLHLDKVLQPDLVDGNLFSSHISVPMSNSDTDTSYRLESITIDSHTLPGFKDVKLDPIHENFYLRPGQISTLILKITNKHSQIPQTKCQTDRVTLSARLTFTGSVSKDVQIQFRCRSSKQSFLFTFIDHDGSIQLASAIKPLKPCETEKCPVLLTLHGTGKDTV